jgi:hypothetical protein
MMKRGLFLLLVILAACSNPTARKGINASTASPIKSKTSTIKPVANPWTISSFAPKQGETEGRKFVRFVTEGDFSDSTLKNSYLYADVIINTASAGIFLHEQKKFSPAEKFSEPVQIKMTNSSGQELQMNSTRSWNNSGGILIERNNNDYSQLRIFLMQSKGTVMVEIKDSRTKIYHFSIVVDGFGESFTKL